MSGIPAMSSHRPRRTRPRAVVPARGLSSPSAITQESNMLSLSLPMPDDTPGAALAALNEYMAAQGSRRPPSPTSSPAWPPAPSPRPPRCPGMSSAGSSSNSTPQPCATSDAQGDGIHPAPPIGAGRDWPGRPDDRPCHPLRRISQPVLSPNTVRGLLLRIQVICSHAVSFGLISASPFERRRIGTWVAHPSPGGSSTLPASRYGPSSMCLPPT